MRLSIIIPVYNVEETLDRCIESIICQEYSDMEIILVDDGSPDNCPTLCDQWAEKDERIKVVHKPNGGLSDARNAGIDVTTGEYLTFVDPDDYLEKDTYQKLMAVINAHPEYDLLEYAIYVHHGAKWQRKFVPSTRVYDDFTEYWIKAEAYRHAYACNKIYRSTLFQQVRFPVGKVFEDVYTLPYIIQHASVIATTDIGTYYYEYNPKGITESASGKEYLSLLDAHLKTYEIWDKWKGTPAYNRYYLYMLNVQVCAYELTDNSILLPHYHINSYRELPLTFFVKAILLNTLGINNMCKFIKTLHKWKKPSR